MTPYSYRKIARFAILLALVAVLARNLHAQYGGRPQAPVLRGTAVLESAGDGWKLIPICIYAAGKFYDAGFYQSTPVPMSLIQGTVYEVQKGGDPIGNFTVDTAERMGAVWYGRGNYRDFAVKPAAAAAPSKGTVQLKDSGPDDRPVLKRTKPAPETVPDGSNKASAQVPAPDAMREANNDPERPMLKRGTQAAPAPIAGPHVDAKAVADSRARRTGMMNVAVSDANTRSSRPFDYHWDEPLKQQLTDSMSRLAATELMKVAKLRGLTVGAKEKITFAEITARAFDVDYSNNPQVVATARFAPSMQQVAGLSKEAAEQVIRRGLVVTVVARVNYNQDLERIGAFVSDPRDLDAFPVVELVDAIDVDADNCAELLFARIGDTDRHFVIYRLYGLRLDELFMSGPR